LFYSPSAAPGLFVHSCHNPEAANVLTDVSRGNLETLDAAHNFDPAGTGTLAGASESEFETIFLGHYERVVGILLRLTGSRAQADELANEVFWRLSLKSTAWLVSNNVAGWLCRSATHAGIDALRASAKRARYEEDAAKNQQADDSHAGPLGEVLQKEDRDRVRRTLRSMKQPQAQILLMRAGGSSYKELAEALDVSVSSIGTLLVRAEAEFRKRYLKLTGRKDAK
jgi:RNA polymerase sigma-70 factor, ECF subfamily